MDEGFCLEDDFGIKTGHGANNGRQVIHKLTDGFSATNHLIKEAFNKNENRWEKKKQNGQ